MLPGLILITLSSILGTGRSKQVLQYIGTHNAEVDFRARNLKTIQTIYNLTTFPNNVPILTNGTSEVPAGLFNINATGRISPVGNFSGLEDSSEYFFALTQIPTEQNNFLAFFEANVVAFTSECPEIATSVVYLNTSNLDPKTGKPMSDVFFGLKQISMWRFDDEGAVLQYEAWIPNLSFYANNAIECVDVLSNKTFGTLDETWGDNVVCREIHVLLARLRPVVHCPHVGKIGGSEAKGFKCTNIKYPVNYFDDQQLCGGDGHPFFRSAKNQYLHIKRDVEGPGALD